MSRFRHELRTATQPQSAAQLVRSGVSRRTLEGPRWSRSTYGYYRPATLVPVTPTQRILDVAAVLPAGSVIGGWAAAYALGADFLDGYDQAMHPLPVTVLLPPGQRRVSTHAIRYVQAARPMVDASVQIVAGLPFTSRLLTATDLARWAPNLVEAVVALDALQKARVVTPSRLGSAAAQYRAGRGARQLRRAVDLSRTGVRSPGESRLRMFWVLELRLSMPLVNAPVFDGAGRFLGAPDLLDEEAGLAIEYDGTTWRKGSAEAGHRDPDQHREDNVREEAFERTGLIVVRADKVDGWECLPDDTEKEQFHFGRRNVGGVPPSRRCGAGHRGGTRRR